MEEFAYKKKIKSKEIARPKRVHGSKIPGFK